MMANLCGRDTDEKPRHGIWPAAHFVAIALALASVSNAQVVTPPELAAKIRQAAMTRIDCGNPGACREIAIKGDSEARLPNKMLAPFRGWGDPSLRQDPETRVLWLSYSWLSTKVKPRLFRKPMVDFVVRTQLAKSVDQGRTFELVKVVNDTTRAKHATKNKKGWMVHEVSTLAKHSSGLWQLMWITYLKPFGSRNHGPAILTYSTARSPAALGENASPWIRGALDPPVADVRFDLSKTDGLGDCIAFTEPSLFGHEEGNYLAINCIVAKRGRRRPDLETLLLFRETDAGYELLGKLLDHADAKAHGGERFEQGELSMARDGAILLLATPVVDDAHHAGCYVFEVESLIPPRMRRDEERRLIARTLISDSKSGERGTGACSYDPHSETGVIVVRREFDFDQKPIKIRFAMMETGHHP